MENNDISESINKFAREEQIEYVLCRIRTSINDYKFSWNQALEIWKLGTKAAIHNGLIEMPKPVDDVEILSNRSSHSGR